MPRESTLIRISEFFFIFRFFGRLRLPQNDNIVTENTVIDNIVTENTVIDNTVIDNTVIDNTVIDNTVIDNTVILREAKDL